MIEIAQKLTPFSHSPGIKILIPSSSYAVEIFPALLRLYDLSHKEIVLVKEIAFTISGPLKEFTATVDFERKCVTVYSNEYHYHVLANGEIIVGKKAKGFTSSLERLSLGSHKKQEWEMIKRRLDFTEIFPLWHAFGSVLMLPEKKVEEEGMFSLLKECEEAIKKNRPEHILKHFKSLFLAAFTGMMVPRLYDSDYQGIVTIEGGKISPLYLLAKSCELIRSIFVQQRGEEVFLLPHLPPEFFCGRFIHVSLGNLGSCDFEWSKKTVKEFIFRSSFKGKVHFHFDSALKTCRMREGKKGLGTILECKKAFHVERGVTYHFDRFQK